MRKTSNPFLSVSRNLKIKPFSTQELVCDRMGITEIAKGSLSYYPNLTALFIPGNRITFLGNLESNIRLTHIDARHNEITEFDLRKQTFLQSLLLSDNRLRDLDFHLARLEQLRNLEVLDLRGNPMTLEKGYRMTVIAHMPWLKVIDGLNVTQRERMHATEALVEPVKSSTANWIHKKNRQVINGRSALATRSSHRPKSVLQALVERPLSAADTIVKRKAERIRKKAELEKQKKEEAETEIARKRAEAFAASAKTNTLPLPDALKFNSIKTIEEEQEEVKEVRYRRPCSRAYIKRAVYSAQAPTRNNNDEIFRKLNPELPPITHKVSNDIVFGGN